MKRFLLVPLIFLTTACSTSAYLVHKQFIPNKEGVVKYSTDGYDWEIDLRKKDAQVQMSEFCEGPYDVISESMKSSVTGASATNVAGTVIANNNYSNSVAIVFKCNPNGSNKPVVREKKPQVESPSNGA